MAINMLLALKLLLLGFCLWLGGYLLALRSGKAAVGFTGWGLVAYALALGIEILAGELYRPGLLVPGLLWLAPRRKMRTGPLGLI
jgi:hypothetical protein